MAKTIKPCPFCGSKAELICFNIEYETVTVGCTNEDCDITMGKGFFSDDEAIEHWNRRVNKAKIRAKAIDAFAEKLKEFVQESMIPRATEEECYRALSELLEYDIDKVAKQIKECE